MAGKTISSKCPACRASVQFSSDQLDQAMKCASCGASFRLKARAKPGVDTAAPVPTNEEWEQIAGGPANVFPLLTPTPLYRPRKTKSSVVVGTIVVSLLVAVGAAAFINRDQLSSVPTVEHKKKSPAQPTPVPEEKKAEPQQKAKGELFPRRMLVVSINQYLYANPILFGSPKRSPAALLERMADKWRIPREQLYLLTDAKNNRGSVPPIKTVVEKAIESFLQTSRPQDRIVLLYAGHATVLDEKPFLVPLDGDLKVANSLIPLSWLSERLQSCKARQKILIVDACRSDPGRGTERPSPGPMDPTLEAAFKAMPAGVQVWTACAANQLSFEYRYQTFSGRDTEGSVFINSFFHAFLQGGPAKQQPQDPLPADDLAAKVASFTNATVQGLEKQPQTPQLFGSVPQEGAGYDANEPLPQRATIFKPAEIAKGGLADPKVVKAIFDEIKCPPIKNTAAEQGTSTEELEFVYPYSADVLKSYVPDYGTVRELLEAPEKYPLRVGVLKAVEVLERHGQGEILVGSTRKNVGVLREEFAGPANDAAKKTILKEQHDGPAAMYLELEDSLKALEKLSEARKDQEKSKRWQAHYDYVLALTKARFAYVNEYNFVLAKIRKDELPPIDPKIHRGWRLAAVERMSSPREVKDQADEAHKLLDRLIKEHPGTPWEILAKRDRLTALGLIWQPAAVKGK
jgi:Caspase domain